MAAWAAVPFPAVRWQRHGGRGLSAGRQAAAKMFPGGKAAVLRERSVAAGERSGRPVAGPDDGVQADKPGRDDPRSGSHWRHAIRRRAQRGKIDLPQRAGGRLGWMSRFGQPIED